MGGDGGLPFWKCQENNEEQQFFNIKEKKKIRLFAGELTRPYEAYNFFPEKKKR